MTPIAQLSARGGASTRASSTRFLTGLAALCAGLVLSACGGGGGGSSSASSSTPTGTTTTPTASVTLTPSAASVIAGQPITLTWTSANTGATTCTASGAWSGSLAASGSQQVTAAYTGSATTAAYNIVCGSTSASASVAVGVAPNMMQMVVDNGPSAALGQINIPYVSVTVCKPGTTTCQTIDHVMVDTGSYGLRLIAPLSSSLGLPAMKTASGAAVGECGQFVSGYTWGTVAQADVKLGNETASNLPIQVIGDTSAGAAPTECQAIGANIGNVQNLGANGILGVGLFKQDCGSQCATTAVSAYYYACTGGSCSSTTMPLAQQVTNPVAAFTTDNNGVLVNFPAVATGGVNALTGTLTFGIGTQANNAMASSVSKFVTDGYGQVSTVYKGTTLNKSFLDTGSNGLFFNDSSLAKCTNSTDFFCPSSPVSLSATITSPNTGASATIPFTIESVDALPNSAIAGWIGGPIGTSGTNAQSFDWGLPFFFGRTVYIGMESTVAPYWAF